MPYVEWLADQQEIVAIAESALIVGWADTAESVDTEGSPQEATPGYAAIVATVSPMPIVAMASKEPIAATETAVVWH